MAEITIVFAISVFVAGLFMFLAPCTLPLVPAYLAFISGVKNEDFQDLVKAKAARRSILINGITFILGFSLVFILFGVMAGFLGAQIGQFRDIFSKIGGVFIIIFGLIMLGAIKIDFLLKEKKLKMPSFLTPGNPLVHSR